MGGLNPFRHQLPSTSPIHGGGLLAGLRVLGGGAEPEAHLSRRLEALLEHEHEVAGATLCGSGTEALLLALESAERLLRRPVTVLLPAFSCFDVAAAAARFGRPVRFYDVSPRTLGPELESLRDTLRYAGAEAPVVLTASLFGVPLDWNVLDPLLEPSGALVIEDAAQGHGARWQGARLGGHGRLGILSFSRGKGWTGGTGGALLVRDAADLPEVAGGLSPALAGCRAQPPSRTENLAILARATVHWMMGRPSVYGLPRAIPALGLGETRYRDLGAPTAMPASAVALALATREAAEASIALRRRHTGEYAAALPHDGPVRSVVVAQGGDAGCTRFPLLLPGGMAAFKHPRMARKLGAEASYPRPLPTLPVMQALLAPGEEAAAPSSGVRWPGSVTLASDLVTLPTHAMTRPAERRRLVELLPGPV